MKSIVLLLSVPLLSLVLPLAAAVSDLEPRDNLLNNPESVVYDLSESRYLVSNWEDGNIVAIDTLGNQTYFNTEMDQAAGLHILNGVIYAASTEGTVTGIVGFDLVSGIRICRIDIPGKRLLNDITSDGSDHLFVTDCDADRIYSVNLNDMTSGVLVDEGLGYPNGIIFDENSNSLWVLNGELAGGPLLAVNLEDTSISLIVETGLSAIDGLSVDEYGCTYFSSWTTDKVYRYDSLFTNPPETVSEGHTNPADIYYNIECDILAIPNFHGNSVDLVPLDPMSSMPDAEVCTFEPGIRIYPNPFRYATRMKVSIPSGAPDGNLSIYSLDGRLLRTFPDSGESSCFEWNGTDGSGNYVPPGMYVAVFETESTTVSGRVIMLDQ